MSEAKPKKAFLPERAAAWIAAFLLTAAVTLTVLGALAVQVLTSAGLHLRTATDGKHKTGTPERWDLLRGPQVLVFCSDGVFSLQSGIRRC